MGGRDVVLAREEGRTARKHLKHHATLQPSSSPAFTKRQHPARSGFIDQIDSASSPAHEIFQLIIPCAIPNLDTRDGKIVMLQYKPIAGFTWQAFYGIVERRPRGWQPGLNQPNIHQERLF
ncbi:hypothetical protein CISG_06767 [Coccidioides immitis RMSCC 3703]|uniref:Uncharacterized protein n=2 Tax=Coccidioides immitis TaxID=5501 RepID=A0A0J8QYF2_COCIT|nr:hypothetical protein CIRG_05301 [Coccidioides immitis RMSCC 2394]KMU77924.1 hypothetical protein CISG_06767 [Coccidioides immitis RMSCC 3703]